MNLRKIWLIAKREYTFNFRRRSFLFAAFGVPLITIVIIGVVIALAQQAAEDISGYKSVGIVDQEGVLVDASGASTVKLTPPFKLVASQEEAQAAVAKNELDGYFVIPKGFKQTGRVEMYSLPSHSLSEGLQTKLEETIKQALAQKIGDASLVARLQNPLQDLEIYRIGSSEKLDATALVATFIAPLLVAILIFMSMNSTSQFLMSGLVEEKENRMMELFITSSRASEMLWGKILGLGALGLTQVSIWGFIAVAAAIVRGVDVGKFLVNLQLTPPYLLMILVYFVLGYLSIGGLLFGVGASVNADQESRQLGGLITMLSVLPFIFSFTYFTDPNGAIPVFLSLFPLTAPVGMLLRAAWTDVPPAQIALSLALLALSVVVIVWLAALVFRLGMLNYGKRLSIRDIVLSIREGRRTIVSSPHQEAAL